MYNDKFSIYKDAPFQILIKFPCTVKHLTHTLRFLTENQHGLLAVTHYATATKCSFVLEKPWGTN
jgi:hypothetical protein